MLFKRVLVGFDGSPPSIRALAAARALTADDGVLVALTVAETHYATHAGMDAVTWEERIRAEAEETRALAEDLLRDLPSSLVELCHAHAAPALLRKADKLGADLIAVGANGHGRMSGMLLGSVATRVVHDARCSVLVARGTEPLREFPSSIVVGVDDSPESAGAASVAMSLSRMSGASVRELERRPVDGLIDASRSADLLVVGSRGLQGLSSVRSVSERVAHEAECPVLIVRNKARAGAPRHPTELGVPQG